MVSPKDLGWQIVSLELQNTILPDRTREFINPLILYQLHFCPMRFLRKTGSGLRSLSEEPVPGLLGNVGTIGSPLVLYV